MISAFVIQIKILPIATSLLLMFKSQVFMVKSLCLTRKSPPHLLNRKSHQADDGFWVTARPAAMDPPVHPTRAGRWRHNRGPRCNNLPGVIYGFSELGYGSDLNKHGSPNMGRYNMV